MSGGASGELERGMSGETVDEFKPKTLIENAGNKGVLSDGVRISEEPNFLVGESKTVNVISETDLRSVETGNLEANDRNDANKNRDVGTVSQNYSRWESCGVINMVGGLLDGRRNMDNEVEDVDDSENQGNVNLVADKDVWQGAIGELTSENIIDIKRTDIGNDSVKLDSSGPGEASGLNGNQDLISHEMVPSVPSESEKKLNDRRDLFVLETHGGHDITEKEGEYDESDLVWGKVKSHPWWPGQIFSAQSASDKAVKHLKNGSYLLAFFGDQTFACNEISKIKPFRMYFSEMERQSNSERFCHAVQCALDEAARRVEFGLSCACLCKNVHNEIKFQVIENAGLLDNPSVRAGGDNLSGAATFSPGDVLQFLGSLAQCPQSKPDRLQFTISKAQVLAYNRWKGLYQLPVFEEYSDLLEDATLLNVTGAVVGHLPGPVSESGNGASSKKRQSTARDGSSRKRKSLLGEEGPMIKEKNFLISSGSTSSENNDKKSVRRSARNIIFSGENCEMINFVATNSKQRRGRPRNSLLLTSRSDEAQIMEMSPSETLAPDIVLSKLILAAKKPMQGHEDMISVVGFLHKFRKLVCQEKPGSVNLKMNSVNHKRRQPSDFETADAFGVEVTEDSYWTDRIIRTSSNDQVFLELQKPNERGGQPETDVGAVSNLDEDKESNVIMDLDGENPSAVKNEVSDDYFLDLDDNNKSNVIINLDAENSSAVKNEVSDDCCPTLLLLHFSNLEAIPPIRKLNEIFSSYGPLEESETKILTKSKRANVMFKRREDAENAFSITVKHNIFGPALVSYRLKLATERRQARATLKQNRRKNP